MPLSYIQGLSHRNLLGEDYTDCSFIFLYILCTMSIRQVYEPPSQKINSKKKIISHKVNLITSNEQIIHILISDNCVFCLYSRTSKRCSVWPPPELPPNRLEASSDLLLRLPSSPKHQIRQGAGIFRSSTILIPTKQMLLKCRWDGVKWCSYDTFLQYFCLCYVYLTHLSDSII